MTPVAIPNPVKLPPVEIAPAPQTTMPVKYPPVEMWQPKPIRLQAETPNVDTGGSGYEMAIPFAPPRLSGLSGLGCGCDDPQDLAIETKPFVLDPIFKWGILAGLAVIALKR